MQVFPGQRQIHEIAVLAVADAEAGEDAQHLQMPLHGNPGKVIAHLFERPCFPQTGWALLPENRLQFAGEFFRPVDVTISQQGDEIIGQRTTHRILEIDGHESITLHH